MRFFVRHSFLFHFSPEMSMFRVLRGEYKHYKGAKYVVESLAYRESDLNLMVVYREANSEVRFVRPLSEFKTNFTHQPNTKEKESHICLPNIQCLRDTSKKP
jgi:hypothetical protein